MCLSMRKNWIFLFFLCTVVNAVAQFQVEWVRDLGFGQSKELVLDKTEEVVYAAKYLQIFKLDASGMNFSVPLAECANSWEIQNDIVLGIGCGLKKFNHNLTLLETKQLKDTPESDLMAQKGALLNGKIYSEDGYRNIYCHDLSGNKLWSVQISDKWANISYLRISDNHIYVYAGIYEQPGKSLVLFKYDTLGNKVWNVQPGILPNNLIVDQSGNTFMLGQGLGGPGYIVKIDKDGNIVWSHAYENIALREGEVFRDSLYICGSDWSKNTAMYMVLSPSTGDVLQRTDIKISEIRGFEAATFGNFQYIRVTPHAIYVMGEYGTFYPYSFVAKFSDPRFVSVREESKNENQIHIFPNPADNEINIRFDHSLSGVVSLQLFDQLGRIVSERVYNQEGFEAAAMTVQAPGAKGIYILKVNEGQKTYTEKVVFE